ncbi:flap endonuclease-1 [Candidatus Micrarchaeota archaeon]|nr:flap endonuclease-1 [Candidatus Micrarchaeota archaeon]
MGVKLKPILVAHEKTLDQLSGTYAVDAYNALYQFLTIIRQPDGTPLQNQNREITSHLSGLFYRTCALLEKNITPIYVFDGVPSELKAKTIAERVEKKMEAEELLRKAREEGRLEEAAMLAQRTARLTRDMVKQSQKLLDLMGLPWIQAPSEGEAQAAGMVKKGLVDAVASQDFDALLFGAPAFVRNLTFSGRRKLPRRNQYATIHPEIYYLKENLDALKLTHEQLVWAGILIGTDFNDGINGIGPKKALKLVQDAKSFDDINAKLEAPIDYEPLEKLFLHPPYEKVTAEQLKRKPADIPGIKTFMVDENDFGEDRIQTTLEKAFQNADEKQSSLKKWF